MMQKTKSTKEPGRFLSSIGRQVRKVGEEFRNTVIARTWRPHSHLFLVSDNPNWVLSWEMREVRAIATSFGIQASATDRPPRVRHQSIFYASHFVLLQPDLLDTNNHIGMAYFHGKPSPSEPHFETCYSSLSQHHPRIQRVQVTNTAFRDFILDSGIAREKVHLIPIGINLSFFKQQTPERRRRAREKYQIPESAVTVGSFQKDGVGWNDGMTPKSIKGPDIFLKVIEQLKSRIPELFVLLSGPARGYVKAGLEQLKVPYRHIYLSHYPDIEELYHALDLYLVTSREEGGPKAVLESMASGIPLITTRVGQATDLVRHGWNGWMVDIEDVNGLAHWGMHVIENIDSIEPVLQNARKTAEANTYESQIPLWRGFFRDFVDTP